MLKPVDFGGLIVLGILINIHVFAYDDCWLKNKCENGIDCYEWNDQCDGKSDCSDGSDEKNCLTYTCRRFRIKCADRKQCYYKYDKCDGKTDCNDGSDELDCKSKDVPDYDSGTSVISTSIITIVVSLMVVLCVLVSVVVCVYRRRGMHSHRQLQRANLNPHGLVSGRTHCTYVTQPATGIYTTSGYQHPTAYIGGQPPQQQAPVAYPSAGANQPGPAGNAPPSALYRENQIMYNQPPQGAYRPNVPPGGAYGNSNPAPSAPPAYDDVVGQNKNYRPT